MTVPSFNVFFLPSLLQRDDGPNAAGCGVVHHVNGIVDLTHTLVAVGDEATNLREKAVDDARKLRATLNTTVSTASPLSSDDKEEGPAVELLTSLSHTDHNALTPSPVSALQRRAHKVSVTNALKGVVNTTKAFPCSHSNDNILYLLAFVLGGLRVDELNRRENLFRLVVLGGVGVDSDDTRRASLLQSKNDSKTYSSQAKDSSSGASLELGVVNDRTKASGLQGKQASEGRITARQASQPLFMCSYFLL
jgi:hypothetical protein